MVGEVNGLQEEEKVQDMAEGQPEAAADAVTETDAADAPAGEEDSAPTEADKIAALEAELKEKSDRVLRLQADFENFRRRLDNFERALAVEQTDVEAFQKGVEMIHTQLREVMQKHGLEAIEAEGQPFDPNFHQAVMRVEDADAEDGTVTQVLQKGYQAKGRVIRPAMVQVAGN